MQQKAEKVRSIVLKQCILENKMEIEQEMLI